MPKVTALMHTCFLNQGSEDRKITQLLEGQQELQQQWREKLGISQ